MEILIVDDQQEIRDGISRTIDWERHGLHVCGTAADGDSALSLLERYQPGILILDIQMPRMDGLELLQVVNDRHPTVKAILISGYDDFHYAQQAVQLHAYAYLLKPIDEGELIARVLDAKAEIERQGLKLREDAELRRRLDEGMPMLRGTFLERLASGTHPPDEHSIREAHFLGIPTGPGEYQVILLEPSLPTRDAAEGDTTTMLARVALEQNAARFFAAAGLAVSFAFHGHTGLILFGARLVREDLLGACRALRLWANNDLGTALSIGSGPVAASFAAMVPTIPRALSALDYRMVIGRNEIVEFDLLQTSYRSSTAIEACRRQLAAATLRILWALQSGAEGGLDEPVRDLVRDFCEAAGKDASIRDSVRYLLAFQLAQLRIPLRLDFHPAGVVELFNAFLSHPAPAEMEVTVRRYVADLGRAEEQRSTTHNSFIVEKAITFIRDNIKTDISLSTVARALLVHPNYLSRLFRKVTGESFIDHVTRVKIGEAQRLLKEGTDRVYQVSEAVGYRDVEHFTRLFRRLVGVSPSRYREIG